MKYLDLYDFFPFIKIDRKNEKSIDIHKYTDSKCIIFICVNNIETLNKYVDHLFDIKNNSHLFIYYNYGSIKTNLQLTQEAQLRNLLEIPDVNYKVYILSADRRVTNILDIKDLSQLSINILPNNKSLTVPYILVENALSEKLLEEVIDYYNKSSDNKKEYHNTSTKNRLHILPNNELEKKIDNKLSRTVFPTIKKIYNFDVYYREPYKICSYDSESSGRFHSHRDSPHPQQHRKYAMSLILNDDYEGGLFEFPEYNLKMTVNKNTAIIFPGICSHMIHKVTEGNRKVIISFFCERSSSRIENYRVKSDFYKENNIKFSEVYPFTFKYEKSKINDKILKIYSNKSSLVFRSARELAYKDIIKNDIFGLIYDDYDCDKNMISLWKKENNRMQIYYNANRKKTQSMDDKLLFHDTIKDSVYTPESYKNKKDVTDVDALYFVKSRGGGGSTGVHIYDFKSLQKANTVNCVIQKNIINPDLYENRRYKIRQLVLLYNKQVYVHKHGWYSYNNILYTDDNKENFRDKYIIHQTPNTSFELLKKLKNYDLIYKNITLAVKDFKKHYLKIINDIVKNEYVILGFDFIVDANKNVQIIEINHRSNYSFSKNVNTVCNVGFIKDMILLFANQSLDNTDLILI